MKNFELHNYRKEPICDMHIHPHVEAPLNESLDVYKNDLEKIKGMALERAEKLGEYIDNLSLEDIYKKKLSNAQIIIANASEDEIKEFFMNELKDKQLDQLFADIYKICYSKSGSFSFDSKAFQEKYAKLYESYRTKYSESEKVVINLGK